MRSSFVKSPMLSVRVRDWDWDWDFLPSVFELTAFVVVLCAMCAVRTESVKSSVEKKDEFDGQRYAKPPKRTYQATPSLTTAA